VEGALPLADRFELVIVNRPGYPPRPAALARAPEAQAWMHELEGTARRHEPKGHELDGTSPEGKFPEGTTLEGSSS
jgi:hypothetical protein